MWNMTWHTNKCERCHPFSIYSYIKERLHSSNWGHIEPNLASSVHTKISWNQNENNPVFAQISCFCTLSLGGRGSGAKAESWCMAHRWKQRLSSPSPRDVYRFYFSTCQINGKNEWLIDTTEWCNDWAMRRKVQQLIDEANCAAEELIETLNLKITVDWWVSGWCIIQW